MVPKKHKRLLPLLHGAKRMVCVCEREKPRKELDEEALLLARDKRE
jgi:hypothetical protein